MALGSRLTDLLANDDHMLILCVSYSITTVIRKCLIGLHSSLGYLHTLNCTLSEYECSTVQWRLAEKELQ